MKHTSRPPALPGQALARPEYLLHLRVAAINCRPEESEPVDIAGEQR